MLSLSRKILLLFSLFFFLLAGISPALGTVLGRADEDCRPSATVLGAGENSQFVALAAAQHKDAAVRKSDPALKQRPRVKRLTGFLSTVDPIGKRIFFSATPASLWNLCQHLNSVLQKATLLHLQVVVLQI